MLGVAIDRSYLSSSDRTIGEHAEINNHTGPRRRGDQGYWRSFTTMPHASTSLERARAYLGAPPNKANFFIVRICPNQMPRVIRSRLASSLSNAEVLTSEQFRHRTRQFWLSDTGAGAALLGSAILGIIVGTIIVAQTLYSSTKDHLKEFATLRAIGRRINTSSRSFWPGAAECRYRIFHSRRDRLGAGENDRRCCAADHHDARTDTRPNHADGTMMLDRGRYFRDQGRDTHHPRHVSAQ